MKKGWFLLSAMSLLFTYFLNLNLEKEIIVLEKSLEKVLNFESENLYQPCIRQWLLVNSPSLRLCFLHRKKRLHLFTHHISYRSLRSVRAWLLAKSCKPQIWLMSRSVQSGHDTLLINDSLTFLGLCAGGYIRTFRYVLF